MNSTGHVGDAAATVAETLLGQHRKLVEALEVVRRIYHEDGAREQLLEALKRLMECTQNSFTEAAMLTSNLGHAPDATCLATREALLEQISSLREQAAHAGSNRLLPQLIFIDYWLTTHISDEMLSVLNRRLDRPPDSQDRSIAAGESHH